MPKFLAGCHYSVEEISWHFKIYIGFWPVQINGNKIATGQILKNPVKVVKGRILVRWAQKSPELCSKLPNVFHENLCHYLRMGEHRKPCAQSLPHPNSYQKLPPSRCRHANSLQITFGILPIVCGFKLDDVVRWVGLLWFIFHVPQFLPIRII